MKANSNNPPPSLRPLPLEQRIEGESIIGIYPFSEAETTAAIDLPSADSLLRGVSLMVSRLAGELLSDPPLAQLISNELKYLLGGWFNQDLTPYIQLHRSLISPEVRERYRIGGMTIQWDKPKTAFYYMAFEVTPWQVQAVGELNVFHCVSIGHMLTESKAIREGGHPSFRPLGSIEPLLIEATPNLPLRQLSDHSSEHTTNVFDTYLKNAEITVKSGIRMNIAKHGTVVATEHSYHYGIRINIDLRPPN